MCIRDSTNSDRKELYKALGANSFYQSQIHLRREELDLAEKKIEEYRVYSDRLAAVDPADSEGWIEQSYAHNGLGTIAMKRGQFSRAAEEFSVSAQLKQRARDSQPGSEKLVAAMANTLSWLAEAKAKLGMLSEAMDYYHREEELIRPLHEAAPSNAFWAYRLANAMTFQGELRLALGQQQHARDNMLSAEALLAEVVKQDPTNRHWQLSLYTVQMKLLDVDSDLGDAGKIQLKQRDLQDKLAALGALSAKERPARFSQLSAVAKISLAATEIKLGQLADARRLLDDGTSMLETLHASNKNDSYFISKLATALLMQAESDRLSGKTDAALRTCQKAKQVLGRTAEHSADYALLAPYVLAQQCLGEPDDARPQKARLESMSYREARYMKALSAVQSRTSKP